MEHRRTIATSAGATVPAGLRPPARPSGFASRERGARTCRSDAQLDEASFRQERGNARDDRWIGVGMSSPEYLIYRQRRGRVQNTDQVGRHVHLVASRVKKKPVATRFGEDQLKLASLSSGVEVALVVSASINWGKRCPHFLTETRRAARNREKKKKKASSAPRVIRRATRRPSPGPRSV